MKKILLIILFALITIACKKENKIPEYSQADYKTIETFITNQIKESDGELLDIKVLQKNSITTSNVDSIKTGIQKLSFLIANPSITQGQATDSILKTYNDFLNLPKTNTEKPIGKLLFIKVTVLTPSKVEESAYFPIYLNNKGNIPAHIDDLLND